MRKVILYIASSLDGYIAKPGDDLGFLDLVASPGEDYGYHAFLHSVDTVILGRRTYDWVMGKVPVFPHAELETFVITRTPRPPEGKTTFHTGDLESLVLELKHRDGKNIFIDGGAEIVNQLLSLRLIDEIILSIIPILTGDGRPLFLPARPEQMLELINSRHFPSGLVQLHYRCKN
jgi:dihydrofolate reductase